MLKASESVFLLLLIMVLVSLGFQVWEVYEPDVRSELDEQKQCAEERVIERD